MRVTKELLSVVPLEDLQEFYSTEGVEDHVEEYQSEFHWYNHDREDCLLCLVEAEIEDRRLQEESEKEGALPRGRSSYQSLRADLLKVGDYARYQPYPGAGDYAHVAAEALEVRKEKGKVFVTWRKTNSQEEPFEVTYEGDKYLNISRPWRG